MVPYFIRKKEKLFHIPPLLKTLTFLSISLKLKMKVHTLATGHRVVCFQVTSLSLSHAGLLPVTQAQGTCCHLRALTVVPLSPLRVLAWLTHLSSLCSDLPHWGLPWTLLLNTAVLYPLPPALPIPSILMYFPFFLHSMYHFLMYTQITHFIRYNIIAYDCATRADTFVTIVTWFSPNI